MECTQTKSESEMKVAVSRDTVEIDSEALAENWIESTLKAGAEKLFSLKFLLQFFFLNGYYMFESVQARKRSLGVDYIYILLNNPR